MGYSNRASGQNKESSKDKHDNKRFALSLCLNGQLIGFLSNTHCSTLQKQAKWSELLGAGIITSPPYWTKEIWNGKKVLTLTLENKLIKYWWMYHKEIMLLVLLQQLFKEGWRNPKGAQWRLLGNKLKLWVRSVFLPKSHFVPSWYLNYVRHMGKALPSS